MQYYTEHLKIEDPIKYEYGKLEYDDNKFYVNGKEVINNRGIVNDIVYILDNNVIAIKERVNKYFIGILYINSKTKYGIVNGKNKYLFKSLNKKYPSFFVASKYKNDDNKFVKIEFKDWNRTDKMPNGSPLEYIGNVGNIDAEIEALRYYYDLYLPGMKVNKDEIKDALIDCNDGIDKIDYNIFSIDPIGSLDIDDAFSLNIKESEKGKIYEIGVHIASPTSYLTSYINEVLNRVSTVYLPNKKYPMLPEIYSDNILSLLENKKRRALSVIYLFDEEFRMISYEIRPTTVYSIKNYNYDEYDDNILKKSDKLALDFNDISKNIFGNIDNSHILVEKWMIFTNNKVAEYLINNNFKNIILRVQKPTMLKEENTDIISDERVQKYVGFRREEAAEYKIYDQEDVISNSGHYRLGLDFYTHFTSPIRRAVDFYIHALCLSKLDITLGDNEIERINIFTRNHRKFQRQVRRLEFLNNMKVEENELETIGFIIELNKKYISIYIPEYLLEERIYNKELKDRYKLYDKINIKLYIFFSFDNIFEKLKIKIIE